jgi:hypothetical protein
MTTNFFSPLSFVAVLGSGIQDLGSGMGKNQNPGSGINIPDPQHWINHRLNTELDLQSLFGLHVHNCTHCLRPRNPPPLLLHLASYTRVLLVSQDRRHLFVTP